MLIKHLSDYGEKGKYAILYGSSLLRHMYVFQLPTILGFSCKMLEVSVYFPQVRVTVCLICRHVPRVVALADAARLDLELSSLPNLILFRSNGLHAHTHILNAIFNQVHQAHIHFRV